MDVNTYLDRLLTKYSNSFDIYMPYKINQKTYPAYGCFYSHNEKYVLVQEANMWTADSFEHMLFMTVENADDDALAEAMELIECHMEEKLVRKGAKVPEKNHMSSLLTVIIICKDYVSEDIVKLVKSYSFDKGYNFHFRGYSKGRIAIISMEDEMVYLSKAMKKDDKKIFKAVFEEVKEGKDGFLAICEKQGVKPFSQEAKDC